MHDLCLILLEVGVDSARIIHLIPPKPHKSGALKIAACRLQVATICP